MKVRLVALVLMFSLLILPSVIAPSARQSCYYPYLDCWDNHGGKCFTFGEPGYFQYPRTSFCPGQEFDVVLGNTDTWCNNGVYFGGAMPRVMIDIAGDASDNPNGVVYRAYNFNPSNIKYDNPSVDPRSTPTPFTNPDGRTIHRYCIWNAGCDNQEPEIGQGYSCGCREVGNNCGQEGSDCHYECPDTCHRGLSGFKVHLIAPSVPGTYYARHWFTEEQNVDEEYGRNQNCGLYFVRAYSNTQQTLTVSNCGGRACDANTGRCYRGQRPQALLKKSDTDERKVISCVNQQIELQSLITGDDLQTAELWWQISSSFNFKLNSTNFSGAPTSAQPSWRWIPRQTGIYKFFVNVHSSLGEKCTGLRPVPGGWDPCSTENLDVLEVNVSSCNFIEGKLLPDMTNLTVGKPVRIPADVTVYKIVPLQGGGEGIFEPRPGDTTNTVAGLYIRRTSGAPMTCTESPHMFSYSNWCGIIWNRFNTTGFDPNGIKPNPFSFSYDWTPAAPGTYQVAIAAWESGNNYCSGSPDFYSQTSCGPFSIMTLSVGAVTKPSAYGTCPVCTTPGSCV